MGARASSRLVDRVSRSARTSPKTGMAGRYPPGWEGARSPPRPRGRARRPIHSGLSPCVGEQRHDRQRRQHGDEHSHRGAAVRLRISHREPPMGRVWRCPLMTEGSRLRPATCEYGLGHAISHRSAVACLGCRRSPPEEPHAVVRGDPAHRRGEVVLVRHGATAWSAAGRHTGRTDVPLSELGRAQGMALAAPAGPDGGSRSPCPARSAGRSRRRRSPGIEVVPSRTTCRSWIIGDHEGRTTAEIRIDVPDWTVFRDRCRTARPSTRSPTRADRVIDQIQRIDGDVAIFSHGHFLRVLATRWLGLPPVDGRLLMLDAADISVLEAGARAARDPPGNGSPLRSGGEGPSTFVRVRRGRLRCPSANEATWLCPRGRSGSSQASRRRARTSAPGCPRTSWPASC